MTSIHPTDTMERIMIEERLKLLPVSSLMSYSIVRGVENGQLSEVIEMVKSQSLDNYSGMARIVGEDLLTDILNYQK